MIHPLSNITPHPDFDLFSVPPTQLTVESDNFIEYRPISVLNSNAIIQFSIPNSIDEYVELKESSLYVKLKINIKKVDGSKVVDSDWKKIMPVNYLLHSIFRAIDLKINNKSITLSPQTYAYKSYFEAFFGFTRDAKKSFLRAAGFYDDKDSKNKIIDEVSKKLTPTNITEDGEGKYIELMGKLHIDFAFQPRPLIGGTNLELMLVPNDPKFYLITADSTIIPSVEFETVSFYVHKSKVNFNIVNAHEQALNKSNCKYPITRGEVRSFAINKGILDTTIDNAIFGQLPRRMLIAMVSNDAFSGNLVKNPFEFKHYKLNFLSAYLNGIQFPAKAFKPDFPNKLYIREYLSLFESLNQLTTDCVIALTPHDYINGNTIFLYSSVYYHNYP